MKRFLSYIIRLWQLHCSKKKAGSFIKTVFSFALALLLIFFGLSADHVSAFSTSAEFQLQYAISPITNQNLDDLAEGYNQGSQEIRTITLTNTGTEDLTNISVSISSGDEPFFIITQPLTTTLDKYEKSTTFTVKAKDGLPAGTYCSIVTVSADNLKSMDFYVTQEIYYPYSYVVNEDGKTCTITSCYGLGGEIIIPNSIDGYKVTSIGKNAFTAFENGSNLTDVTIPDSVTSIEDDAFEDCSNLISIKIPDSVAFIGKGAFTGCSSLTDITIPAGVTSIEESIFEDCGKLTHVTITGKVTYIGDNAFDNCSSLTNITIPASVTSIGDWAFYDCVALTDITIPTSVMSIGDYAFDSCGNLTVITIPKSVTSIGLDVFGYCSRLTSINVDKNNAYFISEDGVLYNIGKSCIICYPDNHGSKFSIPGSVTSIGDYAFVGCSNLTDITIPNNVTSIGDSAFGGCISLTEITIPDSVTSIGADAFGYCSSLTSINVDKNNAYFISVDGVLYNIGKSCIISYQANHGSKFSIPSSVTSIGESAFDGCSELTVITIPNSVTSIGKWAFANCSKLTSITIPNSVTSIGVGAFDFCSSLTSIYFDGDNPTIGLNPFYVFPNFPNCYYPSDNSSYSGVDTEFTPLATRKITVDSFIENGIITSSTVSGMPGEIISLSIAPAEGYNLKPGSLGYNDGSNNCPIIGSSFTMPDKDITVSAVFETKAITVTGVTVTPSAATMQKGSTQTYSSTVEGANSPAQTVTWEVYGNCSSGTAIDHNGVLTVAADETAENLTVKATSTVDNTQSGMAAVSVVTQGFKPIKGDLNLDGSVNAADAILILRKDAEFVTLTPVQASVADVNGDGKVDSGDAIRVLRYDAGLINDVLTGQ